MDFTIDIEHDGFTYLLDIKPEDHLIEGELPDDIPISVEISKLVAGDKYYFDSIDLTYYVRKREYLCEGDLGIIGPELYQAIIETLNDTFGSQWGDAGQ